MAALPEVFVQNASLEIAWSAWCSTGGPSPGSTVMPFFTDEAEGFDINNQYDWDYAEAMVSARQVCAAESRRSSIRRDQTESGGRVG